MKYCSRCVQPDTRPDIIFDDGVCMACLYSESKHLIDWAERQRELADIAEWAKSRNGIYDCVLGVSGGKDSTYCALYARDTLGLRCLLVNSEPEGITEIGRKNIENLKNLGFDMIQMRPNPKVMKQLIKKDFYEHLNPVKVTEFSLWSSTYIIAEKFNIPLIVQGENPALTLGVDMPQDDNALNADMQNTLKDGWEQYIGSGITEKDLAMFHYTHNFDVWAIWLNYYSRDWSPHRNAEFSIEHGLTIREPFPGEELGTYSRISQLDSDLVQVNQMLKYYKFGFGQCTDHCCYDIRDGLLKREDAWDLLEKYDGKCAPRYIKKFCDYIGIIEKEFWLIVDKFINRDLFYKENGSWVRKFQYDY